jgi:hypothetical protein
MTDEQAQQIAFDALQAALLVPRPADIVDEVRRLLARRPIDRRIEARRS